MRDVLARPVRRRPRPTERLAQMLHTKFREEGREVTGVRGSVAKGYYRTSPFADCYRWTAFCNCGNLVLSIDSFDTVRRCLSYGFTLDKRTGAGYDATANPKPSNKN